MEAIRTRTPGWVMAVAVVLLAVAISLAMGAIGARAKKKGGGGLKTQTVVATKPVPQVNGIVEVTANCPKGYKVTGGGHRSSSDQIGTGSSAPLGNGWRITTTSSTFFPAGQSISAVAVCSKT